MISVPDVSKREAQDAVRLAVQSAAAAAATFLGMQALGLPEKFVGVLSAVLVVQPTVGNTLGEAMNRFIATVVGSLVGVVCLFLLPGGYGTALALAVSMLVMNAIAGIRPEWRYGVVAAVALSLGSEANALEAAQERGVAIGGGALIGALASIVVWPDSATKRARRHLETALRAASARLDDAIDGAQGKKSERGQEERRRYHSNIESARRAAEEIRFDDGEEIRTRIENAEKLYNSVLILNRVAEETDDAADGGNGYRDQVEEIRSLCCKVAEGLAEGDAEQDGRLDEIDDALATVRDAASDTSADPAEHVLKNALVFGLGEVRDSLRALVEAFQDDQSKS